MAQQQSTAPKTLSRRTLFLSDIHLGALSSRPDLVLGFLKENPADTYVLVGDILDLWHPLLPHWTEHDQAVIDHLQARAEAGAKLIYVRGNHDSDPSQIPSYAKLDATYVRSYLHQTRQGKRYLVIHGDEADGRLIRLHAMTRLGSWIDHILRSCDAVLRRLSRRRPHVRGLVDRIILASNAVRYRGRSHEERIVALAREKGVDGVICGHFHIAALHQHFGLTYANCGDWVDSMTALEDPGTGELRRLGGRDYAFGLMQKATLDNVDTHAIPQKAMMR